MDLECEGLEEILGRSFISFFLFFLCVCVCQSDILTRELRFFVVQIYKYCESHCIVNKLEISFVGRGPRHESAGKRTGNLSSRQQCEYLVVGLCISFCTGRFIFI